MTFTGSCQLPCVSGCPPGWICEGRFCAYHPPPPMVTASADKMTVAPGEVVSFSAMATSANGDIKRYFWDFKDSAAGEGAMISHAFDRTGTFGVEVISEDTRSVQGSGFAPVEVCLPPANVVQTSSAFRARAIAPRA